MVDDEQIISQLVFIGKNCGFGDVGAEREALWKADAFGCILIKF